MRFFRRFFSKICSCNESRLRNISVDAVMPMFMVPILLLTASENVICTVLVFSTSPFFIYYLHVKFLRFFTRTKFFFMWTISSVLALMLVFEFSVVPLLEILPEENLIFIICVVGGLICGHETRRKSDCMSQVSTSQTLELGEINQDVCSTCKRHVTPQAIHCKICQTCVLGKKYHCHWLDSCIGSNNLVWYLLCLLFSTAAFTYGSNLTMTTVCRPYIFIGSILLPDDCSDVYDQFDLAICFVSSVYSLLIGLILFFYLIYHILLLCFGKTKYSYVPNSDRQHSNEMGKNALQLFCCKS
ncbi:palmitoyltransferase ZDHHC23 [Copidosoma floridanum]|uniref:palmitoyltransferase ZDHHC23 n=1 Tax=Copidosoma floridanum TaxID=29053 RepID=UPI0006C9BA5B|nr:palmitoyltransferase ZDHHC23 [Copidosoma floridanum]